MLDQQHAGSLNYDNNSDGFDKSKKSKNMNDEKTGNNSNSDKYLNQSTKSIPCASKNTDKTLISSKNTTNVVPGIKRQRKASEGQHQSNTIDKYLVRYKQ